MDREIDEKKIPPRMIIPRGLGSGQSRPGHLPIRLLVLLQLMSQDFGLQHIAHAVCKTRGTMVILWQKNIVV